MMLDITSLPPPPITTSGVKRNNGNSSAIATTPSPAASKARSTPQTKESVIVFKKSEVSPPTASNTIPHLDMAKKNQTKTSRNTSKSTSRIDPNGNPSTPTNFTP